MSTPDISTETLRSAGLRITSGRLALLDHLAERHAPVSLDELIDTVGNEAGDRATVYRNLQAFTRAGLITQVRGLGKRDLYELASRGADAAEHAHVVCVECGRVECVDVDLQRGLPPAPEHDEWSLLRPSLTYWGVCAACKAEASE